MLLEQFAFELVSEMQIQDKTSGQSGYAVNGLPIVCTATLQVDRQLETANLESLKSNFLISA